MRLLDFAPDGPGHIGSDGTATVASDIFLETTVNITGALSSTFSTALWAGTLLPVELTFPTSAGVSDVMTATITVHYGWGLPIVDISQTLTLDLLIQVTGTAHVVPDPALGGLIAMGLGAGGAWLRRRGA